MGELETIANSYRHALKQHNETPRTTTKKERFSVEELKMLKRIVEKNETINWNDFPGRSRHSVYAKLRCLKSNNKSDRSKRIKKWWSIFFDDLTYWLYNMYYCLLFLLLLFVCNEFALSPINFSLAPSLFHSPISRIFLRKTLLLRLFV